MFLAPTLIDTSCFPDEDKYKKLLEELAEEEKRSNLKKSTIKKLMKKTFPQRRKWIVDEARCVTEILDIFPSLTKMAHVS